MPISLPPSPTATVSGARISGSRAAATPVRSSPRMLMSRPSAVSPGRSIATTRSGEYFRRSASQPSLEARPASSAASTGPTSSSNARTTASVVRHATVTTSQPSSTRVRPTASVPGGPSVSPYPPTGNPVSSIARVGDGAAMAVAARAYASTGRSPRQAPRPRASVGNTAATISIAASRCWSVVMQVKRSSLDRAAIIRNALRVGS